MPEPPGPSVTARRVAAYRLGFDRLAGPTGGDPDTADRLAADVAADVTVDRASPMGRYLQARTRFFDRVTVNALERDVAQCVVVGAGYDARAFRYRAPGVRWWEIDRPLTQEDKRSRLGRLGVTTDGVIYIGLDLSDGDVAAALLSTGFEPDAPALYIAEGVAPYLEDETLRKVLLDLRTLATLGTRLAISFRRAGADPAMRARFEDGVAALGEPAVGSITADEAEVFFADCRWRPVELNERAKAAGFVMAAPVFVPPEPGVPPTAGRIGLFVEQMLSRRGGDTLGAHLEDTYGVPVTATKELDLGVHRVERADGSTWVARVFPTSRPLDAVRGDAALLDWLVGAGIPAERVAAPNPVSVHQGHAVLVTEFAPGRHPAASPTLFEQLGAHLARIHRLPTDAPPAKRPGGAWHHLLADATVYEELDAARNLLYDARHRVPPRQAADFDRLSDAVGALTLPPELPTSVVHPDFVPRNIIGASDGSLTVVDWSGSGVGPRVISLGCLLWSSAGHGPSLDAAARAYRSAVTMEPVELDHLRGAMAVRPAVLACWTFATGRSSPADSAAWWANEERKITKAAARAVAQFRHEAHDSSRAGTGRGTKGPSGSRSTSVAATPVDEEPTTISSVEGQLVTETFDYDGGRPVTVYVPPDPPEAVVFAGDGQLMSQWAVALEAADVPSTMLVGAHRLDDETARLHEYSLGFDRDLFEAHETFFVDDVRRWVRSRFDVALAAQRTAVFGVSAGGELALAMGLRHPDIYGVVLCASPGGGYRPPAVMPNTLPRAYLVAGTREPFFLKNATRWADALRTAGGDVVVNERVGSHGDTLWSQEFPLMVEWAFRR
jgi:methyltransferase (TIGR00027 family)